MRKGDKLPLLAELPVWSSDAYCSALSSLYSTVFHKNNPSVYLLTLIFLGLLLKYLGT
jgi:hypothetical protein